MATEKQILELVSAIEKKCPRCKKKFPIEEFGKSSYYCKSCAYFYTKRWRESNPRWKESQKEYRKKAVDSIRNRYLKRTYDITLNDYHDMLKKQNYKCAICGSEDAKNMYKAGTFCVDHDHETGKVRGLLCDLCNVGLGKFRDSSVFLSKASLYISEGGFNYDSD